MNSELRALIIFLVAVTILVVALLVLHKNGVI